MAPNRVSVYQVMRQSWREMDWSAREYLPVFPNTIPYNELLLRDYLRMGDLWVYTRSWELTGFSSPLPMLLYNSKTIVKDVARSYRDEFDSYVLPTGVIVGYVELEKARPLNFEEIVFLFGILNRLTREASLRAMEACLDDDDDGGGASTSYIWPCEVGFFFSKLLRFENPVRYAWRGRKHLAWAPLASISAELEKKGVGPERVSQMIRKTVRCPKFEQKR